ncbi:RICIN domain-containing protein [Bacillus cereus]|uniref:Ricin B lectin domain-containing protein n=1 Tax=Bacillus cereus TaxID=1396 RepID=A0A2B9E3C7_BACCE|nr:RICIN domain-containing protein [Bacillus cereus]PGM94554.1 hypothetical protein CN958_10850 [Bacillus cereus]
MDLYGGTNVRSRENRDQYQQQWRFIFDPSQGTYRIENRAIPTYVLTWQAAQGDNVNVATDNGKPEQYWIVEDAGNGYVYLRNKKDRNKVLDVADSNTANGTNIRAWDLNGGTNQKFKLNWLS